MPYSDLSPAQRQMYQSAQLAKAQLTTTMTGKDVAEWFERWYRTAGYTFLTLALMDRFGVKPDTLRKEF